MESTQSKFRRTLLASAISLAFAGASGFAIAGAQTGEQAGGTYGSDPQAQQQQPGGTSQQPQDQVAQGTTEDTAQAQSPSAAGGGQITEENASQLVGQSLKGPEGDELGQIEQIVRDDQGQLALVVSEESLMGLGGSTQRVVPSDQVQLDEQNQASLQQGDLSQMAEFQEGQYEIVASAEDAQQQQPQDQAALGSQQQQQSPQDQAGAQQSPLSPPEDQAGAQQDQMSQPEDQSIQRG